MKIVRRNLKTGETKIITCEQAYNEVARDNKEELENWAIENADLVEDLISGGGSMEFDGYEYGDMTLLKKKVLKIETVEEKKDKRIAKKLKDLRKSLHDSFSNNEGCKAVGIKQARFDYYLEGLEDGYGIEKVIELLKMSREVI